MTEHIKWKVIYAHKWPDTLYDIGVKYLSNKEIPEELSTSPKWVKHSFRKRMKFYELDDEKIILKTYQNPIWIGDKTNNDKKIHRFVVVKDSDKIDVIKELMSDMRTSALGTQSLYDKIVRSYILGISRTDVRDYRSKDNTLTMLNAIVKKPVIKSFKPHNAMQHWQMDITSIERYQQDKSNTNYKHILVIIDIFSKYVYAFPLKYKDANTVNQWLTKLFLSGDIPNVLHMDNGKEFDNPLIHSTCKQFNVVTRFGAKYSPQTQGFVENKNKHIKRMLHYYLANNKTYEWYDVLDRVIFTINNTKHSITGYTPMQIHKGREVFVNNEYDKNISTWDITGASLEEIDFDDVLLYVDEKIKEGIMKVRQNVDTYVNEKRIQNETLRIDVKEKIETEAKKREEKQRSKQDEFYINNLVRIFSYTYRKSGRPDKIQPIQLRLVRKAEDGTTYIQKILNNPLTVKEAFDKQNPNKVRGREYVKNIRERGVTEFYKIDLKTTKTFINNDVPNIFKIYKKEEEEQIYYKLNVLYDNALWKVERMYTSNGYTDKFYKEHLLLYEPVYEHKRKSEYSHLFIDPFEDVKVPVKKPEYENNTKYEIDNFIGRRIYQTYQMKNDKTGKNIKGNKRVFGGVIKDVGNDKMVRILFDDGNNRNAYLEELLNPSNKAMIKIQANSNKEFKADSEILKYLLKRDTNWFGINILYVNEVLEDDVVLLDGIIQNKMKEDYVFNVNLNGRKRILELDPSKYNKLNVQYGWKFNGEHTINKLRESLNI